MTPHDSTEARRIAEALGRDLDPLIADASEATLARQRARFVLAATSTPRRSIRRAALPLGVALAAAAGAVFFAVRRAPPAAITARVGDDAVRAGQWVDAGAAPLELRFGDGSRVSLSPHTQARIERLDARGAALLIERGSAQASVRHTATSSWRFSAGPYSVDVTGTAFSVAWEPSSGRFDLAMREGRVVLRGPRCAEGIAVRDRDEVHADTVARALTLGPLPRVEVAVAPAPAVMGPTPQVPIPVEAPAPERAVRTPRGGHHPAAERAAHAPAAVVEVDEASAMLREADALRVASQGMRARELLLDVRHRFGGTAAAARAAFVLGVLSLETFHAPAEAARWFELYLRESPDGALAREALGRRVQSLHLAGDDAGAREAAERYLARDPDGPFSPFARGILRR